MELEAETLSEPRFLTPDLTVWASGADSIEIKSFLASEGSVLLKLFGLKSV